MPPETLDGEEPLVGLWKGMDTLAGLPATDARDREMESLGRRVHTLRADLYAAVPPCQRVQGARHPGRPRLADYLQLLFTGFLEIHGDRRFADDHPIMTGFANFH